MEARIIEGGFEGHRIEHLNLVHCCADMKHAHYYGQIVIRVILGSPVFAIDCYKAREVIGRHCLFCGEKIIERNDDNGSR